MYIVWTPLNSMLNAAGLHSTVTVALHNFRPVAVKVAHPSSRAWSEVHMLRSLQPHPNIVRLLSAQPLTTAGVVTTTELAYADLLHLMSMRHASRGFGAADATFRRWMGEVASALVHMHAQGVAHRNVSPENILVCDVDGVVAGDTAQPGFPTGHLTRAVHAAAARGAPDFMLAPHTHQGKSTALRCARQAYLHCRRLGRPMEQWAGTQARLGDFRFATTAAGSASPVGCFHYMPPEMYMLYLAHANAKEVVSVWGEEVLLQMLGERYDAQACDVWSFGVTLYTLAFGRRPFQLAAVTDRRFRRFVKANDGAAWNKVLATTPKSPPGAWDDDPPWVWPAQANTALVMLICNCLKVCPAQRPSMECIALHAWFTDPQWSPPWSSWEPPSPDWQAVPMPELPPSPLVAALPPAAAAQPPPLSNS
jgi:serine/threonine protein kinase